MSIHSADNALRFGTPLARARAAVILLHGRGASAEDIIGLAKIWTDDGIAFLVPSAEGGAWYPQRFIAPLPQNEPWLTSALGVIGQLVGEAAAAGIGADRVGLVGFSQGACLSLEFCARNPRRYAFVGGLSGALIGPLNTPRPPADLQRTPILLGCAERDAHIPVEYVEKSAVTLAGMNADVTKIIYPGGSHSVFPTEVDWLHKHLA